MGVECTVEKGAAWPEAQKLNKTNMRQSISMLPNQTCAIIPAAVMLVHKQHLEMWEGTRSNNQHSRKSRNAYLCQTHQKKRKGLETQHSVEFRYNKETQWNHQNGTFLPLKNANEVFFDVSLFASQTLLSKLLKRKEWGSRRETHPSVPNPACMFSTRHSVCKLR